MTVTAALLPAPRVAARPVLPASRPAAGPPRRGFVLSVDLTGTDEDHDQVLRIVATLAELAGEWFPRARARAVVTAPGEPARTLRPAEPGGFRDRLAHLDATGDLVLDLARATVRVAGTPVQLTAREAALLAHLARAQGRTVTRVELLTVVWGDVTLPAATRTIDVHVRRLRAKTGLTDLVVTVWGSGYRLDPGHPVRIED